MTGAAWALLAVTGAVAALDWYAKTRGETGQRVEYICKPLTMVGLIAVALALDPVVDPRRNWFVAALVLSMIGDIFLMLPTDQFVAGLASFLLAHVAYIIGFTQTTTHGHRLVATIVLVVLAVGLLAARFVPRLLRDHRDLVAPVVVYMAVIATMGITAITRAPFIGALGALLFMSSDATIAETRFVGPRPWHELYIIISYHLGQVGLVLCLAYR